MQNWWYFWWTACEKQEEKKMQSYLLEETGWWWCHLLGWKRLGKEQVLVGRVWHSSGDVKSRTYGKEIWEGKIQCHLYTVTCHQYTSDISSRKNRSHHFWKNYRKAENLRLRLERSIRGKDFFSTNKGDWEGATYVRGGKPEQGANNPRGRKLFQERREAKRLSYLS